MLYFHNDYHDACHPRVTAYLQKISGEQVNGYGVDPYCQSAAERIKRLCDNEKLAVHFLVGGTQTNLTVIAAAIRPHQGVISADSGHINVHETGAIEATGHKVLAVPSADGKLTAKQIDELVANHKSSEDAEHMVQPGMVYISHPTELGTVYSLQELTEISRACRENGLKLFLDGARLGYGLTAKGADVTLADLARLCDVFYIGGTKVGAMFGEAVVISNAAIAQDFRYLMKQRGGMLAKGWLLGAQFDALLEDNLYFEISRHANVMADMLRQCLKDLGVPMLAETVTNQLFPILPDDVLAKLKQEVIFTEMHRVDESHRAIRFCTSWASQPQQVQLLCQRLQELMK